MSIYQTDFYAQRNERTRYAARTILPQVLFHVPGITSAVDVGCGVGTWLDVLAQSGIRDVQGIEGAWTDGKSLPGIPILHHDFAEGMPGVKRRFELAICLEVAEHIAPKDAEKFVALLTDLADVVLFSAAPPGQGGLGHVNEQWPAYWINLFEDEGYAVRDVLRAGIWADDNIPYWYRQNILLFGKPHRLAGIAPDSIDLRGMHFAHPELLKAHTDIYTGQAFKVFMGCLTKAMKRKLGMA
jgi:hypothetical protein